MSTIPTHERWFTCSYCAGSRRYYGMQTSGICTNCYVEIQKQEELDQKEEEKDMNFLKMFRDFIGSDNEEKTKFISAWDQEHKNISFSESVSLRSHSRELAWQIYVLQKEVELLRMKQE